MLQSFFHPNRFELGEIGKVSAFHTYSLADWKKSLTIDIFFPLRQWLNQIEVSDRQFATWLCHLIPASCPFARTIRAFGRSYHIPPLCKLNPLYEELVSLRFRALIYLSE
jgi:hypothetical protein